MRQQRLPGATPPPRLVMDPGRRPIRPREGGSMLTAQRTVAKMLVAAGLTLAACSPPPEGEGENPERHQQYLPREDQGPCPAHAIPPAPGECGKTACCSRIYWLARDSVDLN